jgi:putative transcriptional regulator
MSAKYEKMSLFEQLAAGLEDSIAYSRGELTLVTTELPAPPPKLRAREVRAIRSRLRMSQAVFAATLNVSKKAVQSWEQGVRQPSDAALRILQVVGTEPTVVRAIFGGGGGRHSRVSSRRA